MEKKGVKKEKTQKKNVQKNNKLIAIVIAVVVAALVIIIAVVIGLNLCASEKIDDSYFVSDDKKIVLSLNDEMAGFVNGEFEPSITHLVYYYSGDKINNVKIFFAYNDEKEAKAAYDEIGEDYKEWASNKELNGKYIVFRTDNEPYENLSVETLRSDIESIKAVGGAL
ncbi:hypothetical protein IJJ36_03505 [Candidatus Saccharibacteria bacterium]|nr:hypothetical protein [Candidatus Saccharibacteria bacterium]